MSDIDSTDEQIARLLGRNARQNSEALAKQLKLSSATVRRRVRKLIRKDLLRIVGIVDPTKFGFPVSAVIALNVAHDKIESVVDTLAKWPEVKWISMTAGRFDIITVGQFRSTNALSEFLTKQLSKIEGLKDSETLICLDVKKGRYTQLERV